MGFETDFLRQAQKEHAQVKSLVNTGIEDLGKVNDVVQPIEEQEKKQDKMEESNDMEP